MPPGKLPCITGWKNILPSREAGAGSLIETVAALLFEGRPLLMGVFQNKAGISFGNTHSGIISGLDAELGYGSTHVFNSKEQSIIFFTFGYILAARKAAAS
jgi:hypothetical protein